MQLVQSHSVAGAFRSAKVWILCAAYFGLIMGLYGISFWLPTLAAADRAQPFEAGRRPMTQTAFDRFLNQHA